MFGAIGAKLFLLFMGKWQAFFAVVVVAFLWEVFEFFIETHGHPEEVYGSVERWLYDSVGDILGAVIMAFVVVI